MFLLHRWKFYKALAEDKKKKKEIREKFQLMCKFWINNTLCFKALKRSSDWLFQKREDYIKRYRVLFKIRRVQKRFRKTIGNKGNTRIIRMIQNMKQ